MIERERERERPVLRGLSISTQTQHDLSLSVFEMKNRKENLNCTLVYAIAKDVLKTWRNI